MRCRVDRAIPTRAAYERFEIGVGAQYSAASPRRAAARRARSIRRCETAGKPGRRCKSRRANSRRMRERAGDADHQQRDQRAYAAHARTGSIAQIERCLRVASARCSRTSSNTERTNVSQPVKVCHGSEAARALQSSQASPVAADAQAVHGNRDRNDTRRQSRSGAARTARSTRAARRLPPATRSSEDRCRRRRSRASWTATRSRLPSRKTGTPAVISAVSPMREARSCSGSVTAFDHRAWEAASPSGGTGVEPPWCARRDLRRETTTPRRRPATNETRVRKTSAAQLTDKIEAQPREQRQRLQGGHCLLARSRPRAPRRLRHITATATADEDDAVGRSRRSTPTR